MNVTLLSLSTALRRFDAGVTVGKKSDKKAGPDTHVFEKLLTNES
jgi:hypothetical protein